MRIAFHPYELPLRHVFRTSREARHTQKTLIVSAQEGLHIGYGEATENKFFGASIAAMQKELEAVQSEIERNGFIERKPENWHAALKSHLSSFALCALDEALHDLYGKLMQKPLYALWGLVPKKSVVSSFTIGLDTPAVMQEKMALNPWPIYKIKLGTAEDMDIVRALRAHTDAVFRIDANCAWEADEAIAKSKVLAALGVEFIEQPLKVEDTSGMRAVYEESALPLIADESCQTESDVERCVGLFHGINIKLTKCGGLTSALRMIDLARAKGLKVMVGCMVESSVGISSIAHLLPLLDYVDMDGALLISEDPAEGVKVHAKGIQYATGVGGTGAKLKRN